MNEAKPVESKWVRIGEVYTLPVPVGSVGIFRKRGVFRWYARHGAEYIQGESPRIDRAMRHAQEAWKSMHM